MDSEVMGNLKKYNDQLSNIDLRDANASKKWVTDFEGIDPGFWGFVQRQ